MVIGGDAGGMSAATQARRRRPDLEIVALEKGGRTSYSACGIPYLVGGEIAHVDAARRPHARRSSATAIASTCAPTTRPWASTCDARKVEVRDHDARPHAPGGVRPAPASAPAPTRSGRSCRASTCRFVRGRADPRRRRRRCWHGRARERVPQRGRGRAAATSGWRWPRRSCSVGRQRHHASRPAPHVMRHPRRRHGGAGRRARCAGAGIDVRTRRQVERVRARPWCTPTTGSSPPTWSCWALGVAPNSGAGRGRRHRPGSQRAPSRSTGASGPAPTACGPPATAPRVVPPRVAGARCTWRSARWPTSRAVSPASTSVAATPRSPGSSAPPSPRCATPRSPAPGLSEHEADEAGFELGVGTGRQHDRGRVLPRSGAVTVKVLAERGTGRLLGGQIVGADGRGQADRHPRHGDHRGHDGRRGRRPRPVLRPALLQRVGPVQIAARKAAAEVARRPALACRIVHLAGNTAGTRSGNESAGTWGRPHERRRHRLGADRRRHSCCS